jgi:dihydropteroate synthase
VRIMWRLAYKTPMLMGILNVTPDSFSDGGDYLNPDSAIAHALKMQEEQADIIDIGGESSRPGADPVSEEEELRRVIPVIEGIRKVSDILISIDTVKAGVARTALKAGANWINDISGLRSDTAMVQVAAEWQCPVVIMHMQNTPKTMQLNPVYEDVVQEISRFFRKRSAELAEWGITKCILDPGIGFGKRLEDNIAIIKNIAVFKQLGYPVLLGTSRKSFLGALTGRDVTRLLAATLSVNLMALKDDVDIFRVHAIAEHHDMITIYNVFGRGSNHDN